MGKMILRVVVATVSFMASVMPCMAWQSGFMPSRLQVPLTRHRPRAMGGRYSLLVPKEKPEHKSSSTALTSIIGNIISTDAVTTGVELVVAACMLWALVWSMNPDTTVSKTAATTKKSAKKTKKTSPKATKPVASKESKKPVEATNKKDKESVFEDAVFAAAAELQEQLNDVAAKQEAQRVEDEVDVEVMTGAMEQQIALAEALSEPAPDAPAVGLVPSIGKVERIPPKRVEPKKKALDVKTAMKKQADKEAEVEKEEHRYDELRDYLQRKASEETIARMESSGKIQSSSYLSSLSRPQTAVPPRRTSPELKQVNTKKAKEPTEQDTTAAVEAEPKAPKKQVKVQAKTEEPVATKREVPKKTKKKEPKLLNTIKMEESEKVSGDLAEKKKESLTVRALLKRRSIIIGVFIIVLGRRLVLTWLGRGMM